MKNKIVFISALVLFSLFFTSRIVAQTALLDSIALFELDGYTDLAEAIKHPESVIKLELHKTKLKVFPPEILKMVNLQYLDLSKNNIKEIPPEIGELKNLQYLSLSKNKLEDLPIQIGDLTNLYYFNANQNDLYSLPSTIGNLINLRNIDLWSNNIDKFPTEMKNLKNLQLLDLRVIVIPDAEQARLQGLLPQTKIFFSPFCKCQQ